MGTLLQLVLATVHTGPRFCLRPVVMDSTGLHIRVFLKVRERRLRPQRFQLTPRLNTKEHCNWAEFGNKHESHARISIRKLAPACLMP